MANVMMDAVVFGRVWEGGGLPITGMEVVFACDGMMVVVMDLVVMKGLMMWGSLISVVEAVMDDGGDDGDDCDGGGFGKCSRCGDRGSGSCSDREGA